MKAPKYFSKDQHGMTGLETAIILIAFVTVAAVFGYAVLSAGLFSAEQGKSAIYAGLNEAKSNLELSGSVIARSDDSVNVRSVLFTVKNAIAGNPIDMTPNDGSGKNKCVISLTTDKDYINNVKWSKSAIGADNGNNLLETGEQFEITVDLTDLGPSGPLSENLTANQKFSLQLKPALGSTITIQRTLPPAIGPVMDLDLMTSFGGGGSSGGGTPAPAPGSLALVGTLNAMPVDLFPGTGYTILFDLSNTGGTVIDMTPNDGIDQGTTVINLTTPENGTLTNVHWFLNSGSRTLINDSTLDFIGVQTYLPYGGTFNSTNPRLQAGDAFTVTVTPAGGPTLTMHGTAPAF